MHCGRNFAAGTAAAVATEKANDKGQGQPQHLYTMGLMNARHDKTPLHSWVGVSVNNRGTAFNLIDSVGCRSIRMCSQYTELSVPIVFRAIFYNRILFSKLYPVVLPGSKPFSHEIKKYVFLRIHKQ
jgi:hypothetical protein